MVADPLIERDQLIGDLRGALHDGESGLMYVPRLLRKVLETEAWRERFDTKTRSRVAFSGFVQFVTTPATEGLGATVDLIDRIVGTDDPDLLRLLHEAKKVGRGSRTDLRLGEESTPSQKGENSSLTARRLAVDAPEEYEAVKRGEKSIHAAALSAGIRRRRIPVRLDSPESAAKTLRRHMPPEARQALARLLLEED